MEITLEQLLDPDVPNSCYAYYDHPHFGEQRLTLAVHDFTKHFWNHGWVVLDGIMTDELINNYCSYREKNNIPISGWAPCTPYMQVREIRDLCCYGPLSEVMNHLFVGEALGLHLNLTSWVSTERNFHMDCYLNPPQIGSHYVAAWFALEDISPDAGPFEYIDKSHRLPFMTTAKTFQFISDDEKRDPNWPKTTERITVPAVEKWIADNNKQVDQFLGKRGDVLLWHSRLLHRGSVPRVSGMLRKALIAHYSVVSRRFDMPRYRTHFRDGKTQGVYFDL